jgi:large subunit ribosomal protein L10
MSSAEITKLADLESREVLLAKVAGGLKATLTRAAYAFSAKPAQVARVIDALRQKQESEGAAA